MFLGARLSIAGVRPWSGIAARIRHSSSGAVSEEVRKVMRRVPQPVVVVTTADKKDDVWHRRGITVSSFTPISLHPEPIVSFCVRIPSRASEVLHSSGGMVVNILSHEQVRQSVAFSSPNQADQFKDVPFYDDPTTGQPVLMGTIGSMHCKVSQVLELGDHELWITRVCKVDQGVGTQHGRREETQPLLYHDRMYRSVGEQVFMKAFEEASLDTKLWTHRAHVRMAWNYLREEGRDKASPIIKETIRRHFESNPNTKQRYHDTLTTFYIHLVDVAVTQNPEVDDFFDFIERYPQLTDRGAIYEYYSHDCLKSAEARNHYVPPDLKPLPTKLKCI